MRKTTRLFAFLLAATMLFTLLPLSSLAASTALQGKTIIAVGDSLTAYGESNAYASILSTSAYLGVPVINAGVGGDTTTHVLNRFEEDVLSQNPDVVTICLGMNDQACVLASGEPYTPFDTYREHLTYFANKLHEIDCDVIFVTPQPVVVGTGYYPVGGGQYGLNHGYGYIDDFCNIMREVALDTNCNIVDIFYECDFVDVKQIVSADGIHQTNYGRQQYAKYISESMLAIYDGNNKATMTVNCVDDKGNLLKSSTITGKAGAHITVPTPYIMGYYTNNADVPTVYTDGATFTFTYSYDLENLVNKAMSLTHNAYGAKVIELVRDTIDEANAIIADSNAKSEDIVDCYARLKSLISIDGTEKYVLSTDASYTTTATNRNDEYDDDGVRLTDGVKGYPDGKTGYAGWINTPVEIVVDLGKVERADYFSVYCASSQWGIKRPNNLTVSVSTNGTSYTTLGTETAIKNTIETKERWDTSIISVVVDTPVEARYVKFEMNPNGAHVWMDEVEVSLTPERARNGIYVTGFNKGISTAECVIFTPDFGIITPENANHRYTANAVAKWNSGKNAYIVSEVSLGTGANTADIALADDEILIAAHMDPDNYVSVDNYNKVASLTSGQELTLNGLNIADKSREFASYIAISDYPEEEPIDGNVFWVTHYDNNTAEGAGVIFTNTYDGCGWCLHVAFKPVDGLDNVYEVVAKDTTDNGGAKPLPIPEGGFVWVASGGNNYADLENDDTRLNYSSDACKAAVSLAKGMQIGEKYQFSGIDLNTREVATSTPHIDYFAPEYVCDARYSLYDPDKAPSSGKSYTTTTPNRDDDWDDDGIRLTDGLKGTPNGGTELYSGWDSSDKTKPNSVEVVVDLGKAESTDTYTVYLAGGNWGIKLPSEVISLEVLVSDSKDGEYTSVASAPIGSTKLISGSGIADAGVWSVYSITATAKDAVSARFIKFVITHAAIGNGNIWMDEVEADLLGNTTPDPDPTYIVGDVNDDKKVDSVDYLLVKRSCFNTYTLSNEERVRANVNNDAIIDSIDYVLIKRIVFGTYTAQ